MIKTCRINGFVCRLKCSTGASNTVEFALAGFRYNCIGITGGFKLVIRSPFNRGFEKVSGYGISASINLNHNYIVNVKRYGILSGPVTEDTDSYITAIVICTRGKGCLIKIKGIFCPLFSQLNGVINSGSANTKTKCNLTGFVCRGIKNGSCSRPEGNSIFCAIGGGNRSICIYNTGTLGTTYMQI